MNEPTSREDRKALIKAYKETPRPMGVYRVLNTENGHCLMGTSVNVSAILNRHRAQLRMSGHPDHALQRDWDSLGPEAFTFEILDTLEPDDEPGYDPAEDLRELEAMWVEKLDAEGVERYG